MRSFDPVIAALRILALCCAGVLTAGCPGGGDDPPLPAHGPSAPSINLSAGQGQVASGGSTTLSWSTTDATACTASGAWTGAKPIAGTSATGLLTSASSEFRLSCSGPGGQSDATVTVTVLPPASAPAPTLSLTGSPASVVSGGSASLEWSSENADGCVASGAWNGNRAVSGSAGTGPLTATSTYMLACTGAGGSVSRSVTVTVVQATPAPSVSFSANPTSVPSGAGSTLSWSTQNASSCTASGAWSGSRPTSGSAGTGALTSNSSYTLACSGAGGTTTRSVTVTVIPQVPAPTLTLNANPTQVSSGGSSTLSWSSTNADGCTASGGWNGARAPSGSESTQSLTSTQTFNLSCTGAGGTANRSVSVTVTAGGGTQSGLDFQGNSSTTGTVRFHFTSPLAIYPATYIWKVYPRQQSGYYTTFFWGNDGSFFWDSGAPNSYYGVHPYPNAPPGGNTHRWEVAVDAGDYVDDANGNNTSVQYGRWHTQALRVWADGSGNKHHEFYWDLPDTSRVIRVVTPLRYGNSNPPSPVLVWGDAPWNPSNEILNGILRGIQVYSADLSLQDVLAEASDPTSTSAGAAGIWYLNLNPTPSDISDKSGKGHHPSWVGSERPLLWSGP